MALMEYKVNDYVELNNGRIGKIIKIERLTYPNHTWYILNLLNYSNHSPCLFTDIKQRLTKKEYFTYLI